jgi:hypothetical protein
VRAEQAASLARQEACHAASMYELQGLKQMIIKMRSHGSASPTPSVTIATKTGAPVVHVPASGAAMHQQTEVGMKNQNAFRRALLPLGLIIILRLTCAEGGNVPEVTLKGHNVTHGPRHVMDPHRDKITPTDFEMLVLSTDGRSQSLEQWCDTKCGVCGSYTCVCQGR